MIETLVTFYIVDLLAIIGAAILGVGYCEGTFADYNCFWGMLPLHLFWIVSLIMYLWGTIKVFTNRQERLSLKLALVSVPALFGALYIIYLLIS